jgi:NAD(P)H dehydrogenase (quinone)
LTGDQLTGVTPALTGAEAVDLAEVADLLGVRRVVVTDDEYVARQVANGVPEHYATLLLGMFEASRRGDFAPADPTLARLLGRPPVPVRELLK